ncbi:hypothetical protein L0Y41_01880 [bacterium]|nr:hypothetical protein [bacterium]
MTTFIEKVKDSDVYRILTEYKKLLIGIVSVFLIIFVLVSVFGRGEEPVSVPEDGLYGDPFGPIGIRVETTPTPIFDAREWKGSGTTTDRTPDGEVVDYVVASRVSPLGAYTGKITDKEAALLVVLPDEVYTNIKTPASEEAFIQRIEKVMADLESSQTTNPGGATLPAQGYLDLVQEEFIAAGILLPDDRLNYEELLKSPEAFQIESQRFLNTLMFRIRGY